MGCEGGSLPKRSEMVKTVKKVPTQDAHKVLLEKWLNCYISKLPLHLPVVSCGLGYLYNKQALLEYLLSNHSSSNSDSIPVSSVDISHISSLKDTTLLTLTPNPQFASTQQSLLSIPTSAATVSPFICPITLKEMNALYRFVYYTTCGCVVSEQAMLKTKSDDCLVCNKKINIKDRIVIYSTDELEKKELLSRMLERKLERKKKKKPKKNTEDNNADLISKKSDVLLENVNLGKHALDSPIALPPKKQQYSNPNINANMPDLKDPSLLPLSMRTQTDVVKSLFVKKDKNGKVIEEPQGYLVRGTFNRFATGF